MSTKEQIRETVLKELLNGQIDGTEAALKIGISVRHVKRLKQEYLEKGAEGLIHQSRGRTGSRKIDGNTEKQIISIVQENYADFGPLMATEKLSETHGITFDPETIRQMMIRAGIWKMRQRKKPEYFAWRERRSAYGELQQFDGSYHNWFEGRNPEMLEACLLASIDDATGKITCAEFAANEGIEAVFWFWWKYLLEHGIPIGIYLDKFSTYKINHPQAVDNHDLMTQFQRAAQALNINLITAHTPQAKGRVERLFQTLQDRLVKELRLHHISTVEEANIFLKKVFIPWFNSRYAVKTRNVTDMHRQVPVQMKQQLTSIFSVQSVRSINNDFTIQFKNTWYQLREIQPTTVHKGDKVIVEERLDGTIHIRLKEQYLDVFTLPERPKKMKTNPLLLTTHKLNWRPPVDHPWRHFIIS
jgi:transposase